MTENKLSQTQVKTSNPLKSELEICRIFSENLVILRTQRGWTQQDLAREAFQSEPGARGDQRIYKIEKQLSRPSLFQACRIAQAFGCTVDEFITR